MSPSPKTPPPKTPLKTPLNFLPKALLAACAAALMAVLAPKAAGAEEPALREEPEVRVRDQSGVRVRTGGDRAAPAPTPGADGQSPRRPAPAPDPETTLVAIVNAHSLTRAQLDRQIAARSGGTVDPATLSAPVEIFASVEPGRGGRITRDDLENLLIDRQDDLALQSALRDLQGELINEWIEHKLLADEARRHGFAITQQEFERRLSEIRARHLDPRGGAPRILEAFGMSEADLEEFVYEALLIEKLLQRWVDLNLTDGDLMAAYQANPAGFVTPPLYRAPLFTIVLLGDETRDEVRGLERLANEVRRRLRDGEPPAQVFADRRFDIHQGVFGDDLGFYNLQQNTLPPEVVRALSRMRVGEVSDVLTQYVNRGGRAVPESMHVVMLKELVPSTGHTFESALPKLREASLEAARMRLLERLRASDTHRVITNTGGIRATAIPPREERVRAHPPLELSSR